MATIRQSLDITGGVIPFLIIAIYDTVTPTVEVARVVYTNGVSPLPFQYQFIDLENGTYIVKVYESPDGSTLGNVRHDFWVDAVTNTVIGEKLYYTGDGSGEYDPVGGSTSVTDPYFEGKTIAGVFKEGFRFLRDTIEWERTGNTINLLRGATIEHDEVLTVEISQVIAAETSAATLADPYDRVKIITNATYALDTNDLLYTLSCRVSSGLVQTINFLPAGSIGEGRGVRIQHDGNAVNVEIRFNTGEQCLILGTLTNVIYLGKGESVKIVSTSAGLLAVEPRGQWDRIGRREGVDALSANMIAAIPGTTYDGTIYKRLFAYVSSLPANRKVSTAAKATYANRGFWGVTGNNILPPYMDGMMVKFALDSGTGARVPGNYEEDENKKHNHTPVPPSLDSAGLGLIGYLPPGRNVQKTVNQVDITAFEPNVRDQPSVMLDQGNDQNTVRNISQIPVILI